MIRSNNLGDNFLCSVTHNMLMGMLMLHLNLLVYCKVIDSTLSLNENGWNRHSLMWGRRLPQQQTCPINLSTQAGIELSQESSLTRGFQ
jgi:hypothetical protein